MLQVMFAFFQKYHISILLSHDLNAEKLANSSEIRHVKKVQKSIESANRSKTSSNIRFCFMKIAHRRTLLERL